MPTMTSMAPMPAMAEQVHGDEGDADQDPQPVCHEPLHDVSSSNYVVEDVPNAGLDEMPIAVVQKGLFQVPAPYVLCRSVRPEDELSLNCA